LNRSEVYALGSDTEAHILLPEQRVKTGKAFYLPVTGRALALLREAWQSSNSEWVFPGRSGVRPIKVATLSFAMKRFCDLHQGTWSNRPTPHDLRRTLRTNLSMLNVPPEDCRAVLNHAAVDIDGKVYDCYGRVEEKRRALQLWSDRVEAIIAGK
jgi:integrase